MKKDLFFAKILKSSQKRRKTTKKIYFLKISKKNSCQKCKHEIFLEVLHHNFIPNAKKGLSKVQIRENFPRTYIFLKKRKKLIFPQNPYIFNIYSISQEF